MQAAERRFLHTLPGVSGPLRHCHGAQGDSFRASSHKRPGRVCGTTAMELCETIDAVQVDNAGIYWAFGHASLMGIDPRGTLRVMGRRLKKTYAADNSCVPDHHIMPFLGNTAWRAIVPAPALTEISCQGDFAYVTHCAASRMPGEEPDNIAAPSSEAERYLLNLA